jgi:hypothetical protein
MTVLRRLLLAGAVLAAGAATFSSVALAQSSDAADQTQVIDAVKTIFVAAKADDLEKFHSVVAPGFYLYDLGARFDGDAIMTLMKSLHAAGEVLDWNVTEPDVHITGNTAWIAYVNRGSATIGAKTETLSWLESAFLEKQGGVWKIVFMHSTRVPEAKKS